MQKAKEILSVQFLFSISLIAVIITLAAYSFSDMHNKYDFLAPVAAFTQFIFAASLLKGKLWGLIAYTLFTVVLIGLVLVHYSNDMSTAIKTALAISPLILIELYLWIKKRNLFR